MVIAMKQLSLFAMGKEKNTFSDICDRLGCDNNIPAWPDFFGRAIKLTPEESKLGIGGRYGSLLDSIPPGLNYSFCTEEMGHPNPIFAWRSKFSDFLYKADPNMPVRTIKASGGAYTGPFHWDNRFFTYPEYKRLQTFPDDYEISGKNIVI